MSLISKVHGLFEPSKTDKLDDELADEIAQASSPGEREILQTLQTLNQAVGVSPTEHHHHSDAFEAKQAGFGGKLAEAAMKDGKLDLGERKALESLSSYHYQYGSAMLAHQPRQVAEVLAAAPSNEVAAWVTKYANTLIGVAQMRELVPLVFNGHALVHGADELLISLKRGPMTPEAKVMLSAMVQEWTEPPVYEDDKGYGDRVVAPMIEMPSTRRAMRAAVDGMREVAGMGPTSNEEWKRTSRDQKTDLFHFDPIELRTQVSTAMLEIDRVLATATVGEEDPLHTVDSSLWSPEVFSMAYKTDLPPNVQAVLTRVQAQTEAVVYRDHAQSRELFYAPKAQAVAALLAAKKELAAL